MPIVTMPDGTEVEMPDNPNPEQIAQLRAIHQQFQAQKPPAPKEPTPATFGGVAETSGGGFLKGVTGAANFGGKAVMALSNPMAFATQMMQPRENNVLNTAEDYLRDNLRKPENAPEKYGQSIGEGVGASLIGPGGWARNAIIGAMAGTGAEVGERVIGGNAGRAVGGILGGTTAALPAVFSGNTQSLARRALKDVSDSDITAALAARLAARESGMDLTLGQALGKPTNVDALEGALANAEVGRGTQSILRSQPEQVANATRESILKLPGQIVPENTSNAMVQTGATKVLKGESADLSAKVAAVRPTEGNMAQREVVDMMGRIEAAATRYPPGTSTGDSLRALSASLINQKTGKPYTNITEIDNILKDAASGLKAPSLAAKPVDKHGQKLIQDQISDIRAMIGVRFPNFAKSNEIYQRGQDTIIKPLKESVIGQLARRNGFQEGEFVAGDLMKTVLSKGTNPDAVRSDILTMQKWFTKHGQSDAFITPVKSYLSNLLMKAVKLESSGPAAGAVAPKAGTASSIKSALQEDVLLRTGLKDMLVGMARAQKLPDDAIHPGFMRVMDVVTRAAKRPGRVMGMNEPEIRGDGARNALSNALRVFSFMPVEKVAGNMERVYSNAAMRALDRMVTTDKGIKELQRLARIPAGSKEAELAVATMLATAANADAEPVKTP